MTRNDYLELLKSKEYDFLRDNKDIKDSISLLTLGGSRAYGTDIATSDVDIRGIALNSSKQIFLLENDFEQVVDEATDTVIYSLIKMNRLLISCNPNTIEMLGVDDQDILFKDATGQAILDNKVNYLSKMAINSFGGYANQQYNRLEHGLLGNGTNDDKKLQMLRQSLQRTINSFSSLYSKDSFNLSLNILSQEEFVKTQRGRVPKDTYSNELVTLSGSFDNVPITDFKSMISYVHKVQSEYGKLNKRNTKKDGVKLAKHMMHLIRLYYMGIDLNSKLQITTKQSGDRLKNLMSIRNEDYMTSDGLRVLPEFYEMLRTIQDEYDYSVRNTLLPDEPNYDAINEMVINIYKKKYFM